MERLLGLIVDDTLICDTIWMISSGTLNLCGDCSDMNFNHKNLVALADTASKGRGIFALNDIPRGAIVLTCPYIVLGRKGSPKSGTELEHYVFSFPFTRAGKPYEKSGLTALVFGEASLLNHSDDANCTWQWDILNRVHHTVAAREIAKGEELTYFYGWDDETWDSVGGMRA